MPLINCKIELKLKWTKCFVLSTPGNDDIKNNANNIIFTMKDTELYVPFVTLSARDNQKIYQNFLVKGLKDPFIGINIKQKVRIKAQQMNIDIFSNQILLESIGYLFSFIQIKITILKYLKLKNIIY